MDPEVMSLKQMERQRCTVFTPNKQCKITLHAIPLPLNIKQFLETHEKLLEELCSEKVQLSRWHTGTLQGGGGVEVRNFLQFLTILQFSATFRNFSQF